MISDSLTLLIPVSALAGIAFAIFLWHRVSQIKVGGGALRSDNGREYLLEEEQRGEAEVGRPHKLLFESLISMLSVLEARVELMYDPGTILF